MELIYTNESRLKLQISYNQEFVKKVNATIETLKKLCGNLTDEQIRTFLVNPAKLGEELTEKARNEFDAYVAAIPESVRLSMSFNDGGKADAIKKLHKSLVAGKSYNMIDKTYIENGVCLVDEEALKAECSVFGGDESKKIYAKAVECAKMLNELDTMIQLNNVGAECVESWGRWNGIINFSADNREAKYCVNAELLPLLGKE